MLFVYLKSGRGGSRLLNRTFQLLLEDFEVFPDQMTHIISLIF